MKCLHLLLLIVFVVPVMAQRPPALPSGRVLISRIAFDAKTVYWPTAESFKLETDFEGMTDQGLFLFCVSLFGCRTRRHASRFARALRERTSHGRSDPFAATDGCGCDCGRDEPVRSKSGLSGQRC